MTQQAPHNREPRDRSGSLLSAVQRIKTASVVAPLLALTAISGAAATGVTVILGNTSLVWILWTIFCLCVLASIISYAFWTFKDPDRLQSEDFRLERHRLDLLGDERAPRNLKIIETTPTANTLLEAVRDE